MTLWQRIKYVFTNHETEEQEAIRNIRYQIGYWEERRSNYAKCPCNINDLQYLIYVIDTTMDSIKRHANWRGPIS